MAELRVKSTGTLKLFENDNTSSVTIASPASLGGDRTVTLPDGDVTLVAGTLANTPAFSAKRHAATQAIDSDTTTKVEFNTEVFDTDNAYDATTNYRFTVPSGEDGKYFFNAKVSASGGDANLNRASIKIYKNGSLFTNIFNGFETNPIRMFSPTITAVMDLSATDYIEVFAYYETVNAAGLNIDDGEEGSVQFYGFKLTG